MIRDPYRYRFLRLSLSWILGYSLLLVPAEATSEDDIHWTAVPVETLLTLKGTPDRPFRQPTDVASGSKGRIYVMDGLNSRVVVFDRNGSHLFSFGSRGDGPGRMLMPVGIGVSPSGAVYVADSGNHRIQVFTPDGKFVRSFALKMGDAADPTDVLPSRFENYCYVIDNDSHQVQVYDNDTGEYLTGWGTRGKNLGEFRYPATIANDSRNNIYVVDVMNARLQTFDPRGNQARELASWGISLGKIFRPKGVALDGNGRIFISDSYLGTVQVFRNNGDFVGVIGDIQGNTRIFTTPTNIIFDGQDRLFVVETKANQVAILRMVK